VLGLLLLVWVVASPVERLHNLRKFQQVVAIVVEENVARPPWVLAVLQRMFQRAVVVGLLKFQLEAVPRRRYLLLGPLRYQLVVGVVQQRLQRVVVQLRLLAVALQQPAWVEMLRVVRLRSLQKCQRGVARLQWVLMVLQQTFQLEAGVALLKYLPVEVQLKFQLEEVQRKFQLEEMQLKFQLEEEVQRMYQRVVVQLL
jgi:hypothetical protein